MDNVLPVAMILQSIAAAVAYAFVGRYGSALYWASAGALNFAVVFLIRKFG